MEKVDNVGLYSLRSRYLKQGMSETTVDIILHSWREGTQKQYAPIFSKWLDYCGSTIDPASPNVHQVLEFLSDLFQKGASYSVMNSARSALSSFIQPFNNISFGKLPIVKRYMKGVFEKRPFFPKNMITWDVNILFNYFRSLSEVEHLSLKLLTQKLAMLISIVSGGQRVQTLHTLSTKDINSTKGQVIIPITSVLKQTRPSKHMAPLDLKDYPEEPKICVITHLNEYLKRTESLRRSEKLFISFIKPHKQVSKDTISRWCKEMIHNAGINVKAFTAHSNRSATSSKSNLQNVPLCSILKNAGWSNSRTFARRYNKVVISDVNLLNALSVSSN